MVVVYIYVYARIIVVAVYRRVSVVCRRKMVPIVWRVPDFYVRCPEMAVYGRTACKYGREAVVCAVDEVVADKLYAHVAGAAPLDYYACNVLIEILAEHCLQQNHAGIVVRGFHHTQIVNISVTVEIEVGYLVVIVVQHLFELLQVAGFAKSGGNGLQIEVVADVIAVSVYDYIVV